MAQAIGREAKPCCFIGVKRILQQKEFQRFQKKVSMVSKEVSWEVATETNNRRTFRGLEVVQLKELQKELQKFQKRFQRRLQRKEVRRLHKKV